MVSVVGGRVCNYCSYTLTGAAAAAAAADAEEVIAAPRSVSRCGAANASVGIGK